MHLLAKILALLITEVGISFPYVKNGFLSVAFDMSNAAIEPYLQLINRSRCL